MTIKDVLDNMDSWQEEERNQLHGVMDRLCGVSLQTLREFQITWDGTKSFEEFRVAQNKVIRDCIEIELK